MDFLTSLILLCGYLFVLCVGLVHVIRELSQMSIHVSSDGPPTSRRLSGSVERAHANSIVSYESDLAEKREG